MASDDPRVHEYKKKCSWIDEVCWIEKMESLYTVSDDVILLTETINQWLKTLADSRYGFSEQLLFFSRHVEGGMTTQRIQDVLLLIRSYLNLIDSYQLTGIIIISQMDKSWEDDVFTEVARSRNLSVQVIGRMSIIKSVLSFSAINARALYYLANILRFKLYAFWRHKHQKANDADIIFQLCSSAHKHVDKIIPLMKALTERGYDSIALCWHSNEKYTKLTGKKRVEIEGFSADALEEWCSFADILSSSLSGFFTWMKAKYKKSDFLSRPELNYKSVPIGRAIWPSISFFILVELVQSYRLDSALNNYFIKQKPLAISLWGATVLKQGYLAWRNLCSQQPPLIFHYSVGANIEWPYSGPNSPVDLVFMAGKIHERVEKASPNYSSAKIKICGQARYEGIEDFKINYPCSESRLLLGIQKDFSMYILFDSGMILRGFMAPREQIETLNIILNFACKHPLVALLIKPHPGHKSDILDDMINNREDLNNVFMVDSKMLPYHALNAADILITKFSTLGVEAMLFERPVISCILDGEKRFDIYEGASQPVSKPEMLKSLLNKLAADPGYRMKWHKTQMRMQRQYLSEYFSKRDETPSKYQARVIDECIKCNGRTLHSDDFKGA